MSTVIEPKSHKIDAAILVLILTTIAYVAAFAYEATYLSYFGIPIEFVDVTLRELLLYGAIALGFMFFAIFFSTFLWALFFKTLPPALSKIVFVFTLVAVAATALMLLIGNFQPAMIAGAIGPLLINCLFFVVPIFRFSHMSSYRRRLMATYARSSPSDNAFRPTFLWFQVPNSVFVLAACTIASIMFAYAFGEFRARIQGEFPVVSSPDPCAVLRVSSEGYLCAAIDLQKRTITLGRFKIIDPKSAGVHIVKVGRIKTMATLISASKEAGSDQQPKFTADSAMPTSSADHSVPAAQH